MSNLMITTIAAFAIATATASGAYAAGGGHGAASAALSLPGGAARATSQVGSNYASHTGALTAPYGGSQAFNYAPTGTPIGGRMPMTSTYALGAHPWHNRYGAALSCS